MKDGRNGGGRKKHKPREIPFTEIEDRWRPSPLSRYVERDGEDYVINVLTYVSFSPAMIRVDRFHVAADGTVLSAPRGWAKDYRPGRITGMDEAVDKYARDGAQ